MPITETGIDVQTISVDRKSRRNAKMISMTRMPPTSACSCTLLIARSMKIELSCVHDQLDARHFAVDALDFGADAVGHRDRVLARLLLRPACGRRGLPLMRMNWRRSSVRVLHVGDVAHVDRHALPRHARRGCGCRRCSGTAPGCAPGTSSRPGRSRRAAVFWFSDVSAWTTWFTDRLSAVIFSFDRST